MLGVLRRRLGRGTGEDYVFDEGRGMSDEVLSIVSFLNISSVATLV